MNRPCSEHQTTAGIHWRDLRHKKSVICPLHLLWLRLLHHCFGLAKAGDASTWRITGMTGMTVVSDGFCVIRSPHGSGVLWSLEDVRRKGAMCNVAELSTAGTACQNPRQHGRPRTTCRQSKKPPGQMSSKCCQLIVADSQARTVRLAGASEALAARLDNAVATEHATIMSITLGSRKKHALVPADLIANLKLFRWLKHIRTFSSCCCLGVKSRLTTAHIHKALLVLHKFKRTKQTDRPS